MSANSVYWAMVTVKNGEKTIHESLMSILTQSIPPSLLCVIDDGSVDSTPKILEKIKDTHPALRIITLPDKGYDIRRIVHNWNVACDSVKSMNRHFDFLLISSDDIIFPADYVSSLISEMDKNPKLAIASGTRGLEQNDFLSLPEGAGRLIRDAFFKEIGYMHPPFYGYEAWLLYKAMQMGYSVKKFKNVNYEHTRVFGIGHNWIEYGPAMRCLGYHPAFVFARVTKNIIWNGRTGISRRASIRMLFDYLIERKWRNDPYFRYFEPEVRSYVRSMQLNRLLSRIE